MNLEEAYEILETYSYQPPVMKGFHNGRNIKVHPSGQPFFFKEYSHLIQIYFDNVTLTAGYHLLYFVQV